MPDFDLLAHATRFRFLLYPEGHEYWDTALMEVTVEWRGDDRWAVLSRGFCFDAVGTNGYESIPSERKDEFLARFRFTRDEAVRIAREVVVPKLRAIWESRFERRSSDAH